LKFSQQKNRWLCNLNFKYQGDKMKKFILSLIACVALVQSSYAVTATSALTESLLEYEAITTAIGTDPSFETVIPATEFIVDISRISKRLDVLGDVRYEIVTRIPRTEFESEDLESNASQKHHDNHPIKYIATLNVAANPGIGPNIVTVVSIVPVHHHH